LRVEVQQEQPPGLCRLNLCGVEIGAPCHARRLTVQHGWRVQREQDGKHFSTEESAHHDGFQFLNVECAATATIEGERRALTRRSSEVSVGKNERLWPNSPHARNFADFADWEASKPIPAKMSAIE
jgi:hypothetical protein